MRMRVLLLGGESPLGQALQAQAAAEFIQLEAVDRPEPGWLPEMADQLLAGAKPDLILNLAFYREHFQLGLEDPESLQAQQQFNERLIQGCTANDTTLMTLSSARVFDGSKTSAYIEKDEEKPVGALGCFQAELERSLRTQCPQHVILRFSWLLDASAEGALARLVAELKRSPALELAEEWRGNPTPVADAARVILSVLKQLDCAAPLYGTYHYGSNEPATWISFAQYVIQELIGRGELQNAPAIQPVPFASQVALAGRPQNAVLLARKLLLVFGIKPRSWRSMLPALLDELN
ncbi:sugar nucleotide-binding protein [Halopseudomonas xiamenensis]|uniref:sugar nucleotide-binding protein n=1 Tax=Halopseudomonas xiamenensis TaxID=157792 RepID=UPI001624ADDF|nr:sugar nucleotide-binding protein [Halopseudomonas xiamenensis]